MSLFGYKFNTRSVAFYITVILAILWLLLIFGCGTRNKTGETTKSKNEHTEKSSSEGKVTKESSSSEENSSSTKNDKSDELQEQRVIELFFENGVLKERITELINSKSVDKSTKDRKSLKNQRTTVDSVFTNKTYKTVLITDYKKKVDVESDKTVATNFGGSWFLILAVVIVVGAIFLYFYLKKK